jgi:F0F1-type ATP synthase assembly protein I
LKLLRTKPVNTNDSLGRGMDMALTILVFLGLGYLLDRWLGTRPIFMIALVLVSVVGQFVSMWVAYDRTMRRLESERLERSVGERRAA